jgi:hypothetical protein
VTEPIRGSRVAGAIPEGFAWRVSSMFRQLRHTRGCCRCGAWLAIDQPHRTPARPQGEGPRESSPLAADRRAATHTRTGEIREEVKWPTRPSSAAKRFWRS